MIKTSPSVARLIEALQRVPGIGPRSASRIAFHLLQHEPEAAMELGEALVGAVQKVHRCPRCNTLTELEVCETCTDAGRDAAVLCVVESAADEWMVEQSLSYRGYYFVLAGRLSPVAGVGLKEIGADRLIERAGDGVVREVVLATSSTAEGDATAFAIAQVLAEKVPQVHVTRLARGVPAGVELEYTDLATLSQAMFSRTPVRR